MIKKSLKIYRENVWHFFTILGFVALGVIIAISIFIPNMKIIITDRTNDFVNLASQSVIDFKADEFTGSLSNQFLAIDWKNPLKALEYLFSGDVLKNIFENALKAGGMPPEYIANVSQEIINITNNSITLTMEQFYIVILIVSICSLIGFVFISTILRYKTTNNRNIFRYIISLTLDILVIVLSWYLIILVFKNINNIGSYFACFAIILLHAILTLIISFIAYSNKGVKLKDVFTIKNILGATFSNLLIIVISSLIVGVIFIFNDLLAFLIGIPLMLITTIIVNATTNVFVKDIKLKEE